MAATAAVSPPCALVPCQGLRGALVSTRNFHATKNQRQRGRAVAAPISAKFDLKPPPYPLDALEPHMSQDTISYHWGKHHRGYVENLNMQIVGTDLDGMSLEDIIILSYNKGDILPAFNNAAQIWNHDFFWESMVPNGGGKPSGDLLGLIERDFGSFENFSVKFRSAASTQFGSGWVWLAYKANRLNVGNASNPRPSDEDKKLVVVKSPNAVNPLVWDYLPVLTIDVWEGPKCISFIFSQSRRADYVSMFMEKLVSWETVSARLEMAKAQVAEREREEEKRKYGEDNVNSSNEAVEMYLDSNIEDPAE
ncbi:superoxide dismutase [Fe], chloroplastic isoform X1 [Rhodamnia argentea]|uniref:superoxide dismutase n=1 Tax=Rhodamnia argentea TaxID=178133 RepID=A0A8B8PEX5_9MYRT|nr:superoxide dismutase [Fe], chloroplastic isoform X1 [Rhodamnia argentea]